MEEEATAVVLGDVEQRHRIGERLRRLRQRRGLTLQQVASEVELSLSFLSMLERGQVDISLSRLSRLARFFSISPSELLLEEDASATPSIVTPQNGLPIDRGPGITYRLLSSEHYGAQVVHVQFAPGAAFRDVLVHRGHDFCWIISGRLVLLFGDDEYEVQAGQLVSYDGTHAHAFRNDRDEPAELIGFINPPYW